MELPLSRSTVRSWRAGDADALVRHANNRKIADNLRDRFPFPYTKKDAREFLRTARRQAPETFFAIDVDGSAAGGIGFVLQTDVDRVSSEIGYWLAEPFWGRGIVTEALVAMSAYAIDRHGLTRLYAVPFADNAASSRVLEKAGYHLEGRLRRSVIKNGVVLDQLQYAFTDHDRRTRAVSDERRQ